MHTTRSLITAAAFVTLALGATALAGCSAIDNLVSPDRTQTFENKAGFVTADEVDADWIPDDATHIELRTPSDMTMEIAVILLASKAKLPASCVEQERRSSPILTLDNAPSVYSKKAKKAFVCGDWTIIPSKHGWYGWTPNTEDQGA